MTFNYLIQGLMHPYPPYDALLLVAEQEPMSMEVFLGLYRQMAETGCNPMVFNYDPTEEEGWLPFIADLKVLEMWNLISFEFTSRDRLEVTLPQEEINAYGKTLS